MSSSRRNPGRSARPNRRAAQYRHRTRSAVPTSQDAFSSDDSSDVVTASRLDDIVALLSRGVGQPRKSTRQVASRPSRRIAPKQTRKPGSKTTSPSKCKKTTPSVEVRSTYIWPLHRLDWTVLVRILELASQDLSSFRSAQWLASTARTCRHFHDAAIKVLYSDPPPFTSLNTNMMARFTALMRQLAQKDAEVREKTDFRRTMVRSLIIDVNSKPRGVDVEELIQLLPGLTDVELFRQDDLPPYRRSELPSRWAYPVDLAHYLQPQASLTPFIRLKSWKWSGQFMSKLSLPDLQAMHQSPAFIDLTTVSFVNFQVPSLHKKLVAGDVDVYEEDLRYIGDVAQSISVLPALQSIVLESSTIVDGQFMALLPRTLQSLQILNCWELKADDLSTFLQSGGAKLERLVLYHNQSLNLSFLPGLELSCPNLQDFQMNCTYYRHHEHYDDSEPLYDHLFTPDQVPTWPRSIRSIDLRHLPKWNTQLAEALFQSLIDYAPNMPELRSLVIRSRLDIGWRERSDFRNKWEDRMIKVFRRPWNEPQKYHSLSQWPRLKQELIEGNGNSTEPSRLPTVRRIEAEVNVRSSNRINKRSTRQMDRGTAPKSKRARVVSYREQDTDEESEENGDGDAETDVAANTRESSFSAIRKPQDDLAKQIDPPVYIHGLCDTVDILMDNQNPREFQFDMDDFIDEPGQDSQDDEWNEGQEADDDGTGYAW